MKKYSYTSKQVFSAQRWACVGDAGFFADPLYAAATDFIALSNNMVTELIRLDFTDRLNDEIVDSYNQAILATNGAITHNIHIGYPLFGNPSVMAAKVIWDTAAGWGLFAPLVYNHIYRDAELSLRIRKAKAGYYFLTQRVQQLFIDWAKRSTSGYRFDFIDFLKIPLLLDMRERNLHPHKEADELVADHHASMRQIETLALAIFLIAVEDVLPDQFARLQTHQWLNAWRVTLDADRWEADSLFAPRTPPSDMWAVHGQIRNLLESGNSFTSLQKHR